MITSKRIPEVARFLLAGLATTIFSYGIYLALLLVLPYLSAYVISYAAGIVFSYFINAYFVFKQRFNWHTFFRFPLVYVVQLGISLLILRVAIHRFAVPETLAPLIVIVITVPITYLMSRFILKRNSHDRQP